MENEESNGAEGLMESLFVARQPVFDPDMNIWGYELLYRQAATDSAAEISDQDKATAEVIADGVSLGRTGLPQGMLTLVNFPMNLLLAGFGFSLPAENCVIEILETVDPTPGILEALRNLKAAGYRLALDDFVGQPEHAPFLELADIVKVDVLGVDPAQLPGLAARLKSPSRLLLAEKVESTTMHRRVRDMGFDLFQGFFFRRPEILTGRKLSSSELAKLRLLKVLADDDYDPAQVGQIIETDIALSYRLLRFINSAYFARPAKVESLRQATMLLGQRNLAKWLQAVIMSDMNPTPKGRELVFLSVYRAKFMETLAKGMKSPPAKPDMFFILGLFSLLDALLGQPMADLLHELPLAPEIAQALLGERSVIRAFLELAEDLEDADWKAAQDMLHELDLPLRTASALHQDSLRFAGELVQDLHTKPHKA